MRTAIEDIMSVSEREQAMLVHRERRMAIMIAAYAIKERACIEHEEGKLQILTNLIKDSILTIQEAAKRMNMTEEVFRSKMR